MFVIVRLSARLCQDGCWRSWAHFGTFPECVKVYQQRGAALRRARRIGGTVVEVLPGQSMDACGRIQQED